MIKRVINVHAGHCPDGKGASGAVGLIKESTEARKVKDEVIRLLRLSGHTVYDCTCDEGVDKSTCLKKIVSQCNAHDADLDISIHFNDGVKDTDGNGRQTGTETHATSYVGIKGVFAEAFVDGMKGLGFKQHDCGKGNKGMHINNGLYVLNKTSAPAVLVEVCFVGDKDDVDLYRKLGAEAIGRVIAEAANGGSISDATSEDVKSISAGDYVEVVIDQINIYDSSKKTGKERIGYLLKGAKVKVVKLNGTGSMAKLANGLWICTKNTRKVLDEQ